MNALLNDLALIAAAADPEVLDAVQQQDADKTTTDADALVLAAEAGDVGAPFVPAALATLRNLREQDFAGWMRLRARLKRAGVGITELDKQLRHGDGAEKVGRHGRHKGVVHPASPTKTSKACRVNR